MVYILKSSPKFTPPILKSHQSPGITPREYKDSVSDNLGRMRRDKQRGIFIDRKGNVFTEKYLHKQKII